MGSIIFSTVIPQGEGDSGGIEITTTNLSLSQGGQVGASTAGQGNAGKIIIRASGNIFAVGEDQAGFPSGIGSQVLDPAKGSSEGINITTNNLFLTQGGAVSANTFGQGNAGNITINASGTISADGENQAGFNSGIFSNVESTGVGNAGGINITTANLYLTQGGVLSAGTLGLGNAGAITVNALDTISADGQDLNGLSNGFSSGIYSLVEESGVGNAGEINITTNNLSLTQGGVVSASTLGEGNTGAITINALGTISADGEGTILANLENQPSSGIFSTAGVSGKGNATGIKINTSNLSLTNNAQISVESLGQGNAGNLNLQANSLYLENGASLSASTPVGKGGNITLHIADNLTLQGNSTISAQALEDADGGNINIDAGFVITLPNQNNDIIARAAKGTGGNIEITTQGIFGIKEQSSTPPNNTNDLDASSEFGLDGTIAINQLDVNPAEGLEELPIEVIDVAGLVAQNLCQQLKGSEFIVTGKGGIAPNPSQVRDGEVIEVDLVEPAPFVEDGGDREGRGEGLFVLEEVKEEIVEAQGWMINDRCILELIAYKTDVKGSPAQPKATNICNATEK